MESEKRIIEQEEVDLIAARDTEGLLLYKHFKDEERKLWNEHFKKLSDCKYDYFKQKQDLASRRTKQDGNN